MKYSVAREIIDSGNSPNAKGNFARNTYLLCKIKIRSDRIAAKHGEPGLVTEVYLNRRNPRLCYYVVCVDKAADNYYVEFCWRSDEFSKFALLGTIGKDFS